MIARQRKIFCNIARFQVAVEGTTDTPTEGQINKAKAISQNRLLTQEEFAKLRTQQVVKELAPVRRSLKRKIPDPDEDEDTLGGCVTFRVIVVKQSFLVGIYSAQGTSCTRID